MKYLTTEIIYMKLIEKIEKKEMLRRWAIGEAHVDLLGDADKVYVSKQLACLNAKDDRAVETVVQEILKTHHHSLVKCIPEDAVWYTAVLDVNRLEFNKLYTLPVPDLAKVTNYTYRISYGAKILEQQPDLNPRIKGIKHAFKESGNNVQLSGITLLAKSIAGPYTIVEGNGRLISLYQLHFFERQKVIQDGTIEVVIGFSDQGIV